MKTLKEYIAEVQKELDMAVIEVYRLEGALAMLRKLEAEQEQAKEEIE